MRTLHTYIEMCINYVYSDLWLEWLNDELPLTGLIAESALEMRLLFESATKDYLCKNSVIYVRTL